jgi:hypothetical protein
MLCSGELAGEFSPFRPGARHRLTQNKMSAGIKNLFFWLSSYFWMLAGLGDDYGCETQWEEKGLL